eukprot:1975988-Ditylum_brightwellii.AAC.1
MKRSKQNKHLVCNKDNDVDDAVDNGDDDNVEDNDDYYIYNCVNIPDKHLAHLSQAADCCLMERSSQYKQSFCDKDNAVDDAVDNGDDDSVSNGDDDGVDDGAD